MAAKGKVATSSSPHQVAVANEVHREIFGVDSITGPTAVVASEFEQWLTSSKPFLAFAQNYSSKIRKKVRICRNVDEASNLLCELFTAYLVLQEPKFTLVYEPVNKAQGRGPDYAVTFRTNYIFHIEVTRINAPPPQGQPELLEVATDSAGDEQSGTVGRERRESRRLINVICEKLGQFAPNTPNLLWVWSNSGMAHDLNLGATVQQLKQRVEQRDKALYTRYAFTKPADFIRSFQRLSAILVVSLNQREVSSTFAWWQNKDSRQPLSSSVSRLLHAQLSSSE